MRRRVWVAVIGMLGLLGAAAPARAQNEGQVAARFTRGVQSFGASTGYAHGVSVFGGDSDEVDETRIAGLFLHYGIGLTDTLAATRSWRGNLTLALEPFALWNFEPRVGSAAGASLLLRYNFLGLDSIVPFVDVGSRIARVEFDLEGQRDGTNYSPRVTAFLD